MHKNNQIQLHLSVHTHTYTKDTLRHAHRDTNTLVLCKYTPLKHQLQLHIARLVLFLRGINETRFMQKWKIKPQTCIFASAR